MQTIFAKNGEETVEPVEAQVKGSIPSWLQGTLLRNGPGLFSVGDTEYNHWFDGMSLIHSFTFEKGQVTYRSKFLKSETYKRNIKADRLVVTEFGTMIYPDPCKNIFSRVFTHLCNIIPDFTDNNLINIIRYGQDYYASSEINYINQIDPATLETVGRLNYRNHIALNLATAHPHYDSEGNTYNMGTAIMSFGGPKFVIFKVPADASDPDNKKPALRKCQQICSIPFRSALYPSYYHSFGMTENYIVFVEQPYKLDMVKLATAYFRGISWGKCLRFDKDDITLFHVINRKTGKEVSTRFYGDALVVFHHINAYEEDDHVVFDLISYKDGSMYDMFYIENMRQDTDKFIQYNKSFGSSLCQRFVLPLNVHRETPRGSNLVTLTNTTAQAVMQEDGSVYCKPDDLFEALELPCINYKFNARKYRYFYGSKVEWSPHKIAKFDLVTRKHVEWSEENCFPSEPVFVASPGAVEEDDGVILSSIISPEANISPFMLVLDAKTFKEIARANIPTSVHMDLHGHFIPAV
ncbi:Beta,beta-carotene 15,15'-dioxygenase [Larimichthys crocea]|uniref:Beta,beta-carotene 15,15'-dioxygenase n=1 Tax=Larimichthys crocea TaxID=215358 RepID=A0A0F8ABM7_LARCR|nr:beta,beta-carotene 15,15'-dioxygenase isoform X2 [Larimichthys crocea]KAE8277149.1 Beta,beta-carotene 15,15'-dioxygenase [Larimichthys crocea]